MRKKRVLITSYPWDIHARAVAHAIRAKGHVAVELFLGDYPTLASISLQPSIPGPEPSCAVDSVDVRFDLSEGTFDTIWARHVRLPWLPPSMHPGDREVAARQCDHVIRDLLLALDNPHVFWVNYPDAAGKAALKPHQLRIARASGLSVPRTLVSNDPERIRGFIAELGGTAAYKLLEHAAWALPEYQEVYACYTAPVTVEQLPGDDILRLCPGIFQELLPKQFEVRVACFGDCLMSLRIDSQSEPSARIDWRAGQFQIAMEPYELPEDVAGGVRRFLRSAGLACAFMDFVVTRDGRHVFLEANQQGQFLWMEDRAGLPVLDAMSSYLLSGSTHFQFEPTRACSLSEFMQLWDGGNFEARVNRHVLAREPVSVPEIPGTTITEGHPGVGRCR